MRGLGRGGTDYYLPLCPASGHPRAGRGAFSPVPTPTAFLPTHRRPGSLPPSPLVNGIKGVSPSPGSLGLLVGKEPSDSFTVTAPAANNAKPQLAQSTLPGDSVRHRAGWWEPILTGQETQNYGGGAAAAAAAAKPLGPAANAENKVPFRPGDRQWALILASAPGPELLGKAGGLMGRAAPSMCGAPGRFLGGFVYTKMLELLKIITRAPVQQPDSLDPSKQTLWPPSAREQTHSPKTTPEDAWLSPHRARGGGGPSRGLEHSATAAADAPASPRPCSSSWKIGG